MTLYIVSKKKTRVFGLKEEVAVPFLFASPT